MFKWVCGPEMVKNHFPTIFLPNIFSFNLYLRKKYEKQNIIWSNPLNTALCRWYSSFISWLEDTLLGCPSVSSWGDLSFAGFEITGHREGATPWKRHAGLSRVNGPWSPWQRNLHHFPWLLVLEEQISLPLCRLWLGGPLAGFFLTPDAWKQVNNLMPCDCCWVVFNLPRNFTCSFLPSHWLPQYIEFLGVNNANLELKHFPSEDCGLFHEWNSSKGMEGGGCRK